MSIQLDVQHLSQFIGEKEYTAITPQVKLAHDLLPPFTHHSVTGFIADHDFNFFSFTVKNIADSCVLIAVIRS